LLITALGVALAGGTTSAATAAAVAAAGPPQKIVSLSPTATEMLFAIGAGKQVVAVDDQSSYPERAPRTDLSGLTPNLEAIAGYDPDLVVSSEGPVRKQLEDLGIDVVVLPAAERLADTYAQIRKLGRLTGHAKAADRLVREMRSDVADLTREVPPDRDRPTAYYELDDTYFSADSSTFIGRLLALGGFDNIADDAKGDSGGYPQLSSEFVVDADPDAVFLADTKCCAQSAETFGARPGFDELGAVKSGNVVAVDDDVASRWGPRVVALLRQIAKERAQL
jgi:iron complex transport system substrate-binding protein